MADRTCIADACNRATFARGYCGAHYQRWKSTGDANRYCPCGSVLPIEYGRRKHCSEACKPRCKAPDCDRPQRERNGLCPMHALQKRRGEELRPPRWSSEWVCVVCGAEVKKGSGRRKHCSSACQAADSRHQLASRQPRPESFECRLCGKNVSIKARNESGRLTRTDTIWCRDCGRDSPEAIRFRRYRITPEQYMEATARGCEICGSKDRQLHVDHDHKCCNPKKYRTCGECVRGLICGPCNRALRMFSDDVRSLESAIAYLTSYRKKASEAQRE